jgi:RNA polymerase sigma-70 factor (sigma-E family)
VVTSQQAIRDVDDNDSLPVVDADHGFDVFVREHSRSLARSAFLLTGDRQLAEDLVQTALAKVALRWSRVVAKGDPAPYVRVVVVRTAIAWRRRRWHAEVPTSPLPDAASRDGFTTLAGRDRLQRALLLVPPRQRAAVVLRFYEDLSEAETARVMGCSVGTVKSQTAKALTRLRQVLGDESVSIKQEDDA